MELSLIQVNYALAATNDARVDAVNERDAPGFRKRLQEPQIRQTNTNADEPLPLGAMHLGSGLKDCRGSRIAEVDTARFSFAS